MGLVVGVRKCNQLKILIVLLKNSVTMNTLMLSNFLGSFKILPRPRALGLSRCTPKSLKNIKHALRMESVKIIYLVFNRFTFHVLCVYSLAHTQDAEDETKILSLNSLLGILVLAHHIKRSAPFLLSVLPTRYPTHHSTCSSSCLLNTLLNIFSTHQNIYSTYHGAMRLLRLHSTDTCTRLEKHASSPPLKYPSIYLPNTKQPIFQQPS